MKKTSKNKKDTKIIKSAPASRKAKIAVERPSRKRIKEEEEEEDFIPLDDDLTGLDIYDDEEDEF